MKLIVGLGNPGLEYQWTPHNLGFMVVDRLARDEQVEIRRRDCQALTARTRLGEEPVVLAKPQTFMNLSGVAVAELARRLEIRPEEDLVVIYDELDLPMGTIRIRQRGSSAGHNGMKSIIGELGSQDFARVRIGIAPETRILKPFAKAERKQVEEVVARAAEAARVILGEGILSAMARFNRKPEPPPAGSEWIWRVE